MKKEKASKSISSRVLKTELVEWSKFHYIQQEDFKSWSPDSKERLISSILENKFTTPFFVWEDLSDGAIYCLDGRHRTFALEELRLRGIEVPDLLPATFVPGHHKGKGYCFGFLSRFRYLYDRR